MGRVTSPFAFVHNLRGGERPAQVFIVLFCVFFFVKKLKSMGFKDGGGAAGCL